jgi:CHAD domain-containing protein
VNIELPKFAEVRFPEVINLPPDPRWSFGITAQSTVLRHFREVLMQRAVVWVNDEVEGVHQIRVAARRTRTALQTFEGLWSGKEVRRYLRYLGDFADQFGVARDLDVMVIYLQAELEKARGERREGLVWLLERNTELRLHQQPKLEQTLRRMEDEGFPTEFVSFFSAAPVDLWTVGGADG